MSSIYDVILDNKRGTPYDSFMVIAREKTSPPHAIAGRVRRLIESGGERVWRLSDFADFPFQAVAQALSRLVRLGELQRLGKGLYFRPRQTAFGPSLPNPATVRALPLHQRAVFPSGIAAASLLGFTTQHSARIELATDGLSLPRLIVGKDAVDAPVLLLRPRPDWW